VSKVVGGDQKADPTAAADCALAFSRHLYLLRRLCVLVSLASLPPRLFEPFAVFVLGHLFLAPFLCVAHILASSPTGKALLYL
jgi:hypothetical protein